MGLDVDPDFYRKPIISRFFIRKLYEAAKTTIAVLLIIWVTISFCVGKEFDSVCIEGRLSEAQATAINSLPWEKCPSYREGHCQAQENDRIIIRECSELSKSIFTWRPW